MDTDRAWVQESPEEVGPVASQMHEQARFYRDRRTLRISSRDQDHRRRD